MTKPENIKVQYQNLIDDKTLRNYIKDTDRNLIYDEVSRICSHNYRN